MAVDWKNTQHALKDLASVLKCMRCNSEPILPTRNVRCGHVFCKACRRMESRCIKCNAPVEPIEILQDSLVANLVHGCNIISEVVGERNLWNLRMCNSNVQVRAATVNTPQKAQPLSPNKQTRAMVNKYKRNIDKPNPHGETQLHVACLKPDEDRVRTLLASGANPNTKDYAGWTPLQEAVIYGYTNVCRLLLENGASPNIPGSENRTPLHDAVLRNRVEETKLLLQCKADVNVYDQYGKTPNWGIQVNHLKLKNHLHRDYASEQMLKLLEEGGGEQSEAFDRTHYSENTLETSNVTTNLDIVIYAPHLSKENEELLVKLAAKHKIRVVPTFESSVTHVILETNGQYTTNSAYDVMMATVRGCWLLDSAWISLSVDIDDITSLDLEVFELAAAPIEHTPISARKNAQQKKPGLFNNCHFFFVMQPNGVYHVGEVEFTRDSLIKLITAGGGTILTREPDADHIKNNRTLIPFHVANNPKHPLYKCTHYVIYIPGKDQPRRMYNKSYIKSLPLLWLIESIERFTLVDPTHLGIL